MFFVKRSAKLRLFFQLVLIFLCFSLAILQKLCQLHLFVVRYDHIRERIQRLPIWYGSAEHIMQVTEYLKMVYMFAWRGTPLLVLGMIFTEPIKTAIIFLLFIIVVFSERSLVPVGCIRQPLLQMSPASWGAEL